MGVTENDVQPEYVPLRAVIVFGIVGDSFSDLLFYLADACYCNQL